MNRDLKDRRWSWRSFLSPALFYFTLLALYPQTTFKQFAIFAAVMVVMMVVERKNEKDGIK